MILTSEDKRDISPYKYYKRYKLWDFEMIKLKSTKNYYTQLKNIAADKIRKRMSNYSPSLL